MKNENGRLKIGAAPHATRHADVCASPFSSFNLHLSSFPRSGSALMLMIWAILLMSVTVLGVVEYIRASAAESVQAAYQFKALHLAESGLAVVAKGLDMQPESLIGSGDLEVLVGWLLALGLGAFVLKILASQRKKIEIDQVSDENVIWLDVFGINTPQRRIFAIVSFILATLSTFLYILFFQPLNYQPASKLISGSEVSGYSIAKRNFDELCPAGVFVDDWTVYCISERLANESEHDFKRQGEAAGTLLEFRQDRFVKIYYLNRLLDVIIYALFILSVPFLLSVAGAVFFQFCIIVVSGFGQLLAWLTRLVVWVKTGRF